jgi:hypothetical protein
MEKITMKRLSFLLICLAIIQITCNTVTAPLQGTTNSPPNSVEASEAPVSSPAPVLTDTPPPVSFDPHTWADYKLLFDYWPVINKNFGGSIAFASQSVNNVNYNSMGGYVAVAGCDQVMTNAEDLHALPLPACDDTVSGKHANAYLYILNSRSGEIIATLPPTGKQTTVKSLEFSHDGKVLAYGLKSGQLVLWDVAAGTIEAEIPQPPPEQDWWPHVAAFSPDDHLVAVSFGKGTKIWERATKSFIAEIDDPWWPLPRFSSDGATLMLFAPPLALFSTGDWKQLSSIWGEHTGYFPTWGVDDISPDLTLNADAEIELGGELKNGPVSISSTKTGELLQTLKGTWNSAGWLAFTPDGKYLLRADDKATQLGVWQVDGWKYSDESAVLANIVTPDDRFLQFPNFSIDGRSILLWTYGRLALYGLP